MKLDVWLLPFIGGDLLEQICEIVATRATLSNEC